MADLTQIEYGGWSTNYKLTNGKIELIITGEVGPRVLHFGFVDGENLFYTDDNAFGKTGGDEWEMYGGHRFWHAPEVIPRTYYPDNVPVAVEEKDGYVLVTQPVEPTTGLQKQLEFHMSDDAAHVRVVHRLINTGMWAVTCAPWALSVMAAGGVGVIPQPPRGTHAENLLPANNLTMWAYTNMSDLRWTWGEQYILLRQDSSATTPQKVGALVKDQWAAYVNNNHLFIKLFNYDSTATYPDSGVNVETFTNDFMLELETLGALAPIEPDASVEHAEDWFVFGNVAMPANDDDVNANVLPHVRTAQKTVE